MFCRIAVNLMRLLKRSQQASDQNLTIFSASPPIFLPPPRQNQPLWASRRSGEKRKKKQNNKVSFGLLGSMFWAIVLVAWTDSTWLSFKMRYCKSFKCVFNNKCEIFTGFICVSDYLCEQRQPLFHRSPNNHYMEINVTSYWAMLDMISWPRSHGKLSV